MMFEFMESFYLVLDSMMIIESLKKSHEAPAPLVREKGLVRTITEIYHQSIQYFIKFFVCFILSGALSSYKKELCKF